MATTRTLRALPNPGAERSCGAWISHIDTRGDSRLAGRPTRQAPAVTPGSRRMRCLTPFFSPHKHIGEHPHPRTKFYPISSRWTVGVREAGIYFLSPRGHVSIRAFQDSQARERPCIGSRAFKIDFNLGQHREDPDWLRYTVDAWGVALRRRPLI